jgi:hypothetical protein
MEGTAKQSKALDWVIFLVSLVAMVYMLMFHSEFFWLALPFVLTYLVKALNGM